MKEPFIAKSALYFLWHPDTRFMFSGYGLAVEAGRKERLVGLLMVDRPYPVQEAWLAQVEQTFGGFALYIMTVTHDQGIACQMVVEPSSLAYVRQLQVPMARGIRQALLPLLEQVPKPRFQMKWDPAFHLWRSEFYPEVQTATNGNSAHVVSQTHPNRHPLFALGQVVATPGALAALLAAHQTPDEFLDRHVTGDWQELPVEDRLENLRALQQGTRIFSAYTLANGQRLWLVTEWDRSVTTLLTPAEY